MSTAALASLLSGGVEAGARADLATLLRCERAAGPLLLRLAFHDALTYDARDSTGGCNGSIRCGGLGEWVGGGAGRGGRGGGVAGGGRGRRDGRAGR